MNIFVLDRDPRQAARYLCDKHVVKMILESAQLLSTAHRIVDSPLSDRVYKKTHQNHPCAIWARESSENYTWLWNHLDEMCLEYTNRYSKVHKVVWSGLLETLSFCPTVCGSLTPFAQAMPDEFRRASDPVGAYRSYYLVKKHDIARWRKNPPEWWIATHELQTS